MAVKVHGEKVPAKELVRLPPAELFVNPKNPRRHPEEQYERLVASLKRFGQPKPILARRANKMIIAGHGIHEAARRAGFEDIEVVLWDVDQKTADAFMLGDNRLAELSHHDEDAVANLLREIDEIERLAVGFSEDEAEKLLNQMAADDTIKVVSVDTSEVHDQFWIAVRGPLADQAHVLQRIKELLKEYPKVDVQLGTINL